MKILDQEVCLVADVSRGEDIPTTPETLDFAEMKSKGIVAIWARATDGILEDSTYKIFRENCLKAGMPFGAYGTLYPGDANAQAKKFVEVVSKYFFPELPHVIDWEVPGITWQQADTWLAVVEARWPKWEIWNYTRADILKTTLPNKLFYPTKYARFAKIPVWQAHYYVVKPADLPPGFTRIMHQFTGKGVRSDYSSTGESKELDLEYFFGTEAEFRTRCGLNPAPIPAPIPLTIEERISKLEKSVEKLSQIVGVSFL